MFCVEKKRKWEIHKGQTSKDRERTLDRASRQARMADTLVAKLYNTAEAKEKFSNRPIQYTLPHYRVQYYVLYCHSGLSRYFAFGRFCTIS